jgi:hypothetical protein
MNKCGRKKNSTLLSERRAIFFYKVNTFASGDKNAYLAKDLLALNTIILYLSYYIA